MRSQILVSIFLMVIAHSVWASASSSLIAPGNSCAKTLGASEKSADLSVVEKNDYTNDRVLADYADLFRAPVFDLMKILKNLRPGAIWIDMGSGRNIALVKGLEMHPQIKQGIGINAVNPEFMLDDSRVPGRLTSLEGYIQDLKNAGRLDALKGKVELITDVFGPFSYSFDLRELMQIYLELLVPNGQLLMTLQIERGQGRYYFEAEGNAELFNAVKGSDGRYDALGLIKWLKTIPGVRVDLVEHSENRDNTFNRNVGIRVTKLQTDIIVPDTLHFLRHLPTVPFRRVYELK